MLEDWALNWKSHSERRINSFRQNTECLVIDGTTGEMILRAKINGKCRLKFSHAKFREEFWKSKD